MEVAELKTLRFSLGVTRMDKIRNEYIRGTAQVGRFGEKTRETRLRGYGYVPRKDDGYIGRRMLMMELPWKRTRGRPTRRSMDVVKEDMAEVEVTEEDTEDRKNWKWKIRCGDPWWEKVERRRRGRSIIKYIESDIPPWQLMWYQVLQESHSRAFDFQVTALPHEPHGHLGVLSPGLVSTWFPSSIWINKWTFLLVEV